MSSAEQSVGGGVVSDVQRHPTVKDAIAIGGVWASGFWPRESSFLASIIRGGRHFAALRVVGVERIRTRSGAHRMSLLTAPTATPPNVGDVIAFGGTVVSELVADGLSWPISAHGTVVRVGAYQLPGILLSTPSPRLLVFLAPEQEHSLAQTVQLHRDQDTTTVRLRRPTFEIPEFVLNGHDVSLDRLVNTLSPLRTFLLTAGHEIMFGEPRKERGASRKSVRATFEPTVSVLPGSVRLTLHPGEPAQLSLLYTPADPISALVECLTAVAHADADALQRALFKYRLLMTDRYLRLLRTACLKSNCLVVRSASVGELRLIPERVNWLTTQLAEPSRVEEVRGSLYALDLIRQWCRVLSDSGADWTVYFPDRERDRVKASVDTVVNVEVQTRARVGASIASGRLLRFL